MDSLENDIRRYINKRLSNIFKTDNWYYNIKGKEFIIFNLSATQGAKHYINTKYQKLNWCDRRIGKEKTKKIFLKIFNILLNENKKLILNKIEEDPNFYRKHKKLIDRYIKVPTYITRGFKTNMWDMKI